MSKRLVIITLKEYEALTEASVVNEGPSEHEARLEKRCRDLLQQRDDLLRKWHECKGELEQSESANKQAETLLAGLVEKYESLDMNAQQQLDELVTARREIAKLKEGYGWIAVEDRLPEKTMRVIMYGTFPDGPEPCITMGVFGGQSISWVELSGQIMARVTHWMPLPNPPEK